MVPISFMFIRLPSFGISIFDFLSKSFSKLAERFSWNQILLLNGRHNLVLPLNWMMWSFPLNLILLIKSKTIQHRDLFLHQTEHLHPAINPIQISFLLTYLLYRCPKAIESLFNANHKPFLDSYMLKHYEILPICWLICWFWQRKRIGFDRGETRRRIVWHHFPQ